MQRRVSAARISPDDARKTRIVRLRRLGWRLAAFVLVFGIWELAGRWPVSPAFPNFSDTLLSFIDLAIKGDFTRAYASTLPPNL